ncbi:hypothetical protein SDC9_113739 [bioreactor metagenome]|uniref:Uncharacterized protein n=1 Tax=bioreactor metagenome TaxID=1076179 RepID=A0A645BNK7_9ZZZZ
MRLVVADQSGTDLCRDGHPLAGGEGVLTGVHHPGVEAQAVAGGVALRAAGVAGPVGGAAGHGDAHRDVVERGVRPAGAHGVPVELVVALLAAHPTGDGVAQLVRRGGGGDRLVRVTDPDQQILAARVRRRAHGGGAELRRRVRTADPDVAVGVGDVVGGVVLLGLTGDELALDAVAPRGAAEAVDQALGDRHRPVVVDHVVEGVRIDAVAGGCAGGRAEEEWGDDDQDGDHGRQSGQQTATAWDRQPAAAASVDRGGDHRRRPFWRAARARSVSRRASRSASAWRLSYSRLPVATPISTLA